MRKTISALLASILALVTVSPVFGSTAPSPRQSIVTSGVIQVEASPFPGIGNRWDFTVSKADAFKLGDWVELSLIDSSGRELDSDFEYVATSGTAPQAIKFTLTVYSSLTPQIAGAGIVARVEIDPLDWQAPKATFDLQLPPATFPAAPARPEDYVKFSKASYTFEKRTGCAYHSVDLSISDPYSEVSSVVVSLQTASGVEIADDRVFIDRDFGLNFASLYLCSLDFQDHSGRQKLVLTVEWNGSGRAPVSSSAAGVLNPLSAAAMSAIAKLKNFCVKGKTYKSTTGTKCPSGYRLASFKEPTVVQWNNISRNPGASRGGNFRVFACISQFDSVTGPSAFRAYSSRTESSSYFAETNSYFRGSSQQLLAYSEDDAIVANVTVLGKYSYSTLGGRTSVPSFQIRDLKKIGTC